MILHWTRKRTHQASLCNYVEDCCFIVFPEVTMKVERPFWNKLGIKNDCFLKTVTFSNAWLCQKKKKVKQNLFVLLSLSLLSLVKSSVSYCWKYQNSEQKCTANIHFNEDFGFCFPLKADSGLFFVPRICLMWQYGVPVCSACKTWDLEGLPFIL